MRAQLKAEDEGAAAELKRLLRSTAAVYRTLLSHAEAARVEVTPAQAVSREVADRDTWTAGIRLVGRNSPVGCALATALGRPDKLQLTADGHKMHRSE